MKNARILVGVLLVSVVFLVSCGGTTPPKPPPPTPWIVGSWGPRTYAPFTDLLVIDADGTFYVYDNYDGTGGVKSSGTWSLEGDVLTMNGTYQVTITKVSDNEWSEVGAAPSFWNPHYRKGYEPEGSVFAQTATVLTESVSTPVTWVPYDLKLCSFTASTAGDYNVSWSGGGSDKVVGAYKSDQVTSLFVNEAGSLPSPQTVSLGATEKIFIIVYGDTGGPLDLMVQPAP